MKLSDFVVRYLAEHGVRVVFLLPGGGAMHLCDSVGASSLDYVCCLHEQACAFAAEAYAEYGNQIGCVLVTTGPGGTNAVTGAAAAWIEGAPVLFLSGQVKRADLMNGRGVRSMGPQEVDIVSVVRPVTKYAVQVLDPMRIGYELGKALHLAQSGRPGPVWIDIPLDVQAAEVQPDALPRFAAETTAEQEMSKLLGASLDAFRTARRPVVYVGNGVRTAGQIAATKTLLKKLRAPVLLSWKAADLLDDDDSLFAGRPGGMGQRAANLIQQKSDWILVLGARLDLPSLAFDHDNFAPRAHKTVVDIDAAEVRKLRTRVDVPVIADLRDAIGVFEQLVTQEPDLSRADWLAEVRKLRERFPTVLPEYWERQDAVSTYVLIDVLSDACSASDVIVPGSSGPCSDILMQVWRVKEGQRLLNAPGLGAMGTGLPATIGACLASGRRRTVNVNGDGGFQLNIQDLETVRRLALPIKYFVLDNGGYRSIAAMQRAHFKGRLVASEPGSRLTLPNVARIAEAYGIPAFTVSSHRELRNVVDEVLQSEGPVVCVVKTSLDEATAPRCVSQLRPDGSVVSRPMEDMWPHLDPVELARIMKG